MKLLVTILPKLSERELKLCVILTSLLYHVATVFCDADLKGNDTTDKCCETRTHTLTRSTQRLLRMIDPGLNYSQTGTKID